MDGAHVIHSVGVGEDDFALRVEYPDLDLRPGRRDGVRAIPVPPDDRFPVNRLSGTIDGTVGVQVYGIVPRNAVGRREIELPSFDSPTAGAGVPIRRIRMHQNRQRSPWSPRLLESHPPDSVSVGMPINGFAVHAHAQRQIRHRLAGLQIRDPHQSVLAATFQHHVVRGEKHHHVHLAAATRFAFHGDPVESVRQGAVALPRQGHFVQVEIVRVRVLDGVIPGFQQVGCVLLAPGVSKSSHLPHVQAEELQMQGADVPVTDSQARRSFVGIVNRYVPGCYRIGGRRVSAGGKRKPVIRAQFVPVYVPDLAAEGDGVGSMSFLLEIDPYALVVPAVPD